MDTNNKAFKAFVGTIIICIGYWWVTHQQDKMIEFQSTPAGAAQYQAELKIQMIKACGEAAEKGAIGPGCEVVPKDEIKDAKLVIPSPFSSGR